jgi:hypothetical protein
MTSSLPATWQVSERRIAVEGDFDDEPMSLSDQERHRVVGRNVMAPQANIDDVGKSRLVPLTPLIKICVRGLRLSPHWAAYNTHQILDSRLIG